LKLHSINVQRIWDDQLSAHSCFENLTKLTVDGCEKLKYLFSYSVAERLVKLEHLSISSCKLVEEIFVPDEIMSRIAHVHDEIMSHIPHIRKSSHVEMVSISNCFNFSFVYNFSN
jgi:hypothetical protein